MTFSRNIVILFCVIAGLLLVSPVLAQLTTYVYYKDIYISGSNSEQTNYIKRFDLYRTTGTDINESIYISANVNTSFSDIYFAKYSDDTAYPFMFETRNDTWASVLVLFPTLPTEGTIMRLYYGNTTMNSLSTTTLPGVIFGGNYSQDNGGIERMPFNATGYFQDSTTISYTDPVTADKTERYQNVTGTNALAFDTNHYHMIANTDAKYRLKSYQFAGGQQIYQMKLPASGTDGDYIYAQFAGTADMTLGYGLGVIRSSGKWYECTVLDSVVSAAGKQITGLDDGDTVYVKVVFDPTRGVWYGDISEYGVWL